MALCKRIFCILFAMLLVSCVREDDNVDTPHGNFEALWRIIDEHYCFFDYKQQEIGLDWDAVRGKYSQRVNDKMTETQLFEVLGDMLGELRDGHVNMYTAWDISRYWKWHEDYPKNMSEELITQYLGTDYRITGGMRYRILDDNIGYLRCPSFSNAIGEGNLTEILSYFLLCDGLIIDLRGNGGGLVTSAEALAARFTDEKVLVGYLQHKTGRGHSDFSPLEKQWIKPSSGLRWHKPTVVLTNREVYSAANEFVKYMRCMPGVTIVGDRTGGGAGLPFSDELPNGWSIRFSACPMFDRDRQPTEFGIEPDHNVALTQGDLLTGRDTLIEFARRLLSH